MNAIHHIEMNVSELGRSRDFYGTLLPALGWTQLRPGTYIHDGCEIYLKAAVLTGADSHAHGGPRHLCFRAGSRAEVDRIGEILEGRGATVLRGPMAMPEYSATYYTVDFRDPDGYVLEVAHE